LALSMSVTVMLAEAHPIALDKQSTTQGSTGRRGRYGGTLTTTPLLLPVAASGLSAAGGSLIQAVEQFHRAVVVRIGNNRTFCGNSQKK
jgi:hypothetical protein